MGKKKNKDSFTFFEHLGELRKRILYSFGILVIFFFFTWNFRIEIYDFLSVPITQFLKGKKLIYTSLTEPLMMYIKLSFIGSLFMSSPFLFHQIWLFVSPGLYKNEKKIVLPFVFMATFFFLIGGGFGYYIAFPMYVKFLLNFGSNFEQMIKINEYFSQILVVILGLALMFELPVFMYLLAKLKLITSSFLIKYLKYAIVLILIIAAVITPTPDIINQSIFAFPTIGLYLLSILIVKFVRKDEQ
jgi:sec-independent protein translocase protein TatC